MSDFSEKAEMKTTKGWNAIAKELKSMEDEFVYLANNRDRITGSFVGEPVFFMDNRGPCVAVNFYDVGEQHRVLLLTIADFKEVLKARAMHSEFDDGLFDVMRLVDHRGTSYLKVTLERKHQKIPITAYFDLEKLFGGA